MDLFGTYEGDPRSNAYTFKICNECRPSFEIRPINKRVYLHCACVMSRSPNDGLQSKEDLIRQTKLNMAAKLVENFIFLWGIGERNDVYNLKSSFI